MAKIRMGFLRVGFSSSRKVFVYFIGNRKEFSAFFRIREQGMEGTMQALDRSSPNAGDPFTLKLPKPGDFRCKTRKILLNTLSFARSKRSSYAAGICLTLIQEWNYDIRRSFGKGLWCQASGG
jgi:hypothetical protein